MRLSCYQFHANTEHLWQTVSLASCKWKKKHGKQHTSRCAHGPHPALKSPAQAGRPSWSLPPEQQHTKTISCMCTGNLTRLKDPSLNRMTGRHHATHCTLDVKLLGVSSSGDCMVEERQGDKEGRRESCLELRQAHGAKLPEPGVFQRRGCLLALMLQAPGFPAAQLLRLLARHDAHHPSHP